MIASEIRRFLDRVDEVCPIPSAAQRVFDLTSQADVDIRAVAKVISTDPALAAAVMRIANSAAYSRGNRLSELEQAILRIGLAELHRMAAAMAMLAAFHSRDELSIELHNLSVVSAGIARSLAMVTRQAPPGTAFLCGLLCEIGALACVAVDAIGYLELWRESSLPVSRRAACETSRYGGTSFEIGGTFLERHDLPPEVCNSVRACLVDPQRNWDHLARVTLMARHGANAMWLATNAGNVNDLQHDIDELAEQVELGLSSRQIRELCVKGGLLAEEAVRKTR